MDAVFAALEANSVATSLRYSRWAYPIVNIVHVFGLAALFGAIVTLDLRLIGFWPGHSAEAMARPAIVVAACGLAVAALSGVLLFMVRAVEYAAMPVFWIKIAFVLAGLLNVVAARMVQARPRARIATAAISIACWSVAIAAGRLIGYLEA